MVEDSRFEVCEVCRSPLDNCHSCGGGSKSLLSIRPRLQNRKRVWLQVLHRRDLVSEGNQVTAQTSRLTSVFWDCSSVQLMILWWG